MFFPQIIASHERGEQYSINDDVAPSIDLFANANWKSFRFLGEYFWGEHERHFERFQIGFSIAEESDFWLGRFHTPFGYWHTEYHHGNYLQTSITRPAMDGFGTAGGIITSHISGALFESSIYLGAGKINYSLAYGLGSQLDASGGGGHGGHSDAGLHDVDIFNFERNNHDNIAALRVAYLPDEFGEDQYGVFICTALIPTAGIQHNEVKFRGTGLYSNTQWEKARLITGLYHIETLFREGVIAAESGAFKSAYAQVEYQYDDQWNIFSRIEDTHGADHDIYLETLAGFVPQRQMIGLRFDPWSNHAIKFEWNRNHHEHSEHDVFLIGWSAVFR